MYNFDFLYNLSIYFKYLTVFYFSLKSTKEVICGID